MMQFFVDSRRVHPRLLPKTAAQPAPRDSGAVYALGVYTEFPFDLVTDVHFKQPSDGGPPSFEFTGYCSPGYGYGASAAGHTDLSTPFGPNQFVPFVGTFPTNKMVQSADGKMIYGGLYILPTPDPGTITAAPYGNNALSVWLDPLSLHFITDQLMDYAPLGQVEWFVPMAMGNDPTGIPINVVKYDIAMHWTPTAGYEFGLGVHYFLPDQPGVPSPLPDVPTVSFGDASDGSYTWEIPYDTETDPNKFKIILGWMYREQNPFSGLWGDWTGDDAFMKSVLRISGGFGSYSWTITPTCVARLP